MIAVRKGVRVAWTCIGVTQSGKRGDACDLPCVFGILVQGAGTFDLRTHSGQATGFETPMKDCFGDGGMRKTAPCAASRGNAFAGHAPCK
jgi:hypothetical protein